MVKINSIKTGNPSMITWIALFRGINVGGNNILPMKHLLNLLENVGCTQIKTYIQSGNAIFQSQEPCSTKLETLIEKKISDHYSFAPRVLLIERKKFEEMAASNPFPEAIVHPTTLYLSFCFNRPESPDLDSINKVKTKSESFVLAENVFFLHAPDGVSRSKLAARVEKYLGVTITTRNWATVSKLIELATTLK